MKTLPLVAALAALTITANAQVSVAPNPAHPTTYTATSYSFRPYPDPGGVVKLRFHWFGAASFTMPDRRQVDYLVVQFNQRTFSTALLATAQAAGAAPITIKTPPYGVNWVAVEVSVTDGIPTMRIASYGWGTAPADFEWYQALLPAAERP